MYITAVFNRTSLGVAGLQAAARLGITPAQLSVFVLVQLGVYAAMQVPTGLLVDRFGPRRLLVAAAVTMALAQLAFALTRSYPAALLARGVLGCGDALTFVSVVRVAAQDFPRHRFPLAVSVTSMLGMAGNLAATVPLTLLLRLAGCTPSFAGPACSRWPPGWRRWPCARAATPRRGPAVPRGAGPGPRDAAPGPRGLAHPGHPAGVLGGISCMSLTTMFAVLWGAAVPRRPGLHRAGASAVLLVSALAAIAASPAIGPVFGRFPAARVPSRSASAWSPRPAVLLGGFGGRPPHPLILAVVALSAVGGPASTIGFSLARDYNPRPMVGTASGVVNVGGFTSAILASLLIGGVLELTCAVLGAGDRLAFGCALAVQAPGTATAVRWWLRVRGLLLAAQSRGEPVPVPVVRRQFDRAPLDPVR